MEKIIVFGVLFFSIIFQTVCHSQNVVGYWYGKTQKPNRVEPILIQFTEDGYINYFESVNDTINDEIRMKEAFQLKGKSGAEALVFMEPKTSGIAAKYRYLV